MKNSGQKLWKKARSIIPGGNMLLSKRPEQFLPDLWPAYFSKAQGCEVWDLDGNSYLDMSIMGVGTNILGYGHSSVDRAVRQTIDNGNMSSLNCPEEVWLAEKLVSMHPWADMVKYARSGGEANSIAVRIARAASGRDAVAICGYHGWHDWYLAANLNNDGNLTEHLLPGLPTKGVPNKLESSIFTFQYNNYSELEQLVKNNEIGVIKMEVSRSVGPKDGFLKRVRDLATQNNIVLVFDECTSGFRESFGGLHLKYGVDPDIAVFGKALGNGYAISAVVGRREVMEHAQSSFISSTFWTERIGPTAALEALKVMEANRSWDAITETGAQIKSKWSEIFGAHGVSIETWGINPLPGFSIKSELNLAYKTLITQEMLSRGILASNVIYVCTEHAPELLDHYYDNLYDCAALISQCEDGRDVGELLRGAVCHSGFARLN